MVLSSVASATNLPSGEYTRARTGLLAGAAAFSVTTFLAIPVSLAVATSHTLAVRSELPLARYFPSAENATAQTAPAWILLLWLSKPLAAKDNPKPGAEPTKLAPTTASDGGSRRRISF